MRTPEDDLRDRLTDIIRSLLGDDYISLDIETVEIVEDLSCDKTSIYCSYSLSSEEKGAIVEGTGTGVVDALYNAFVNRIGEDYKSLRELKLVDFRLSADGLNKYRVKPGTGAFVEAQMMIGGDADRILFRSRSRSMNTAAIKVVSAVIEYFINSEIAFLRLKALYADAKSRNREDLATNYRRKIIELVSANSYAKILDR